MLIWDTSAFQSAAFLSSLAYHWFNGSEEDPRSQSGCRLIRSQYLTEPCCKTSMGNQQKGLHVSMTAVVENKTCHAKSLRPGGFLFWVLFQNRIQTQTNRNCWTAFTFALVRYLALLSPHMILSILSKRPNRKWLIGGAGTAEWTALSVICMVLVAWLSHGYGFDPQLRFSLYFVCSAPAA